MAASTTTPPVATYDSGRMAVPTALSVLTAATVDMVALHFANPTAVAITILVTDTAGLPLIPTVEIPANAQEEFPFSMMPTIGLKWQASAAGLVGQAWGWTR